ncbi:LUD domain-containing protein [Halovivax sp.]|uniref:LutC/YkgG family protein n=1 Tax=Halovivax sp. TaxID=1935978 RepID=UPI0025C13508|nr:LUD domain-containing protein [Halovivax sp.]
MEGQNVARFAESLASVGAKCERVRSAELSGAIADRVVEPAVGVELPFAPRALAKCSIETNPSPRDVVAAETGVTPGSFAVASTGSVALPSSPDALEPIALYPERHVIVVPERELYDDLGDGLDRLADAFATGTESVVFATGPSATADMGGLVRGAHGPRDVHVLTVIDG